MWGSSVAITRDNNRGFTLIELMAALVISVFVAIYVGSAMIRLSSLEELNREKARALEKLSDVSARVQTYVAVGALATNISETAMRVQYPYMVFGIACETNRFTQVTNALVEVRRTRLGNGAVVNDNTLQAVIMSSRKGEGIIHTNAMPFLDPLLTSSETRISRTSGARIDDNGIVHLSFSYRIGFDGKADDVGMEIPVRMRNVGYAGYLNE